MLRSLRDLHGQPLHGGSMAPDKMAPLNAAREIVDDLQRLVEAIDRRVPQLERLAEAGIAREAAELRERAVALMRALETAAVRE
jgi:hypothetical protein